MELPWFEKYPHSIWVTAFLYKDKLIDYNIGNYPKDPFSRTVIINTEEDKDKAFNCKAETKEFIVNNREEHNNVFSVLAYDWLDKFEKESGLKFNIDTISKRNAPKILNFLEKERDYQLSNHNEIYYLVLVDFIDWLDDSKEENFLCNNNFYQFKKRYINELEKDNISEKEASILGLQINYLSKLFKKLEKEIK